MVTSYGGSMSLKVFLSILSIALTRQTLAISKIDDKVVLTKTELAKIIEETSGKVVPDDEVFSIINELKKRGILNESTSKKPIDTSWF